MAPKPKYHRGRDIFFWMICSFFLIQLVGGLLLDRVWPHLRFSFLYRQLDRLAEQLARARDAWTRSAGVRS
jgi:cytochrome b subunit of formate dehydrogenase